MQAPTIKLNNGIVIPQLGFGTYQMEPGLETEEAVTQALNAGYRSIDTAAFYENEESVGKAINNAGVPREEIFVTTKLWNDDQGYQQTLDAFQTSLNKLNLEYIDLYLIHWPKPDEGKIPETWKAMEELYEENKIRAIGVCNFEPEHLDNLLEEANVVPAVNQVELHPMFNQQKVRDYCKEKEIHVESWSPLMQGEELIENETIVAAAKSHDKGPGQVILRWHIQNGLIVIPKSVTPERIKSNFDIFDFELTDDEMQKINEMDSGERIGPHPNKL